MTTEEIQTFTRRITRENPTEEIVTMYDIFLIRLRDAKDDASSYRKDRQETLLESVKKDIRGADAVLQALEQALDFKYEIAGNLYSLYDYCRRCLTGFLVSLDSGDLSEPEKIIRELREAFHEIAPGDKRPGGVQNAQQVAAGYTYGPKSLNEVEENFDIHRGFQA